MDSVSGGNSELQHGLSFRDTRIEDLCLDFTLPGFPDIVLASGTDHTMVWHMTFLVFNFHFHPFNGRINLSFSVGKYEKLGGLCFTYC